MELHSYIQFRRAHRIFPLRSVAPKAPACHKRKLHHTDGRGTTDARVILLDFGMIRATLPS